MKFFYILLISLLCLCSCQSTEERQQTWNAHAMEKGIHIVPASKNLGVIPDTKDVNFEFEIVNNSDSILEVFKVRSFCGCTVPDLANPQILPGESGKLLVNFNPRGKSGHNKWEVQIENSLTKEPLVALFEADVVRDHYVSHSSFSFGEFKKGSPAVQKVWVSPREFPNYKIDKWELEVNCGENCFHVNLHDEVYDGFYPKPRKATCITLTADKNIPLGSIDGKLKLTVSMPKQKLLEIPIFGTATSIITTNYPRVDMNEITPNQPVTRNFIVHSIEEDARFKIQDIEITSPICKVKNIEPIGEDRYYEITVEAIATDSTPLGEFHEEIRIKTTHPEEPLITLPIQGCVVKN